MPVYLARFGLLGPVKIGCSANVALRLDQLGARLWDDIHLLRVLDGSVEDERRLHQRFVAQRIRFEWFHYHPDMFGDLGLPDLAQKPDERLPRISKWHSRDPARVDVSNALRQWMVSAGLTEHTLGALLGRKPGTINEWLKAGFLPGRKTANKLIEVSQGALAPMFEIYWGRLRRERRKRSTTGLPPLPEYVP